MGDYSYRPAGYNHKPQRSMGSWDTTSNKYETNSYGWGQTGFDNDESPRDHVCRPVIIDAQGRKRPLIACGPNNHNDGIVTKTETIVEQVHKPQATTYGNSYGYSSPTEDYGVQNDGWVSPTYDQPRRTNIVSSLNWRQTPNYGGAYGGPNNYGRTYDNGSNGWTKPSSNTASVGWATPPTKQNQLSGATHDIATAVEYLVPTSMVPTIDSSEARRRYGNLPSSPQVLTRADSYSSAIDSREAARRYGGQMM